MGQLLERLFDPFGYDADNAFAKHEDGKDEDVDCLLEAGCGQWEYCLDGICPDDWYKANSMRAQRIPEATSRISPGLGGSPKGNIRAFSFPAPGTATLSTFRTRFPLRGHHGGRQQDGSQRQSAPVQDPPKSTSARSYRCVIDPFATLQKHYLPSGQPVSICHSRMKMETEMPQLVNGERAAELRAMLKLPVIAAPMFLISGPELVIACCKAGVIGSFPTLNARSPAILDEWLDRITAETENSTPFAANLIVHRSNRRLEEDLSLVARHCVPLVIASVGSPEGVIERIHAYGGLVFSDVASLKHARRAVETGADGLILLCAGSGGHTGWLNPFAFVGAVREFFNGPVVLAGAISHGRYIQAAERIGADFAYVGTNFIATRESLASDEYRRMLIESNADDIVLTAEVSGIPANMLRSSLERAGFKGGRKHEGFDLLKDENVFAAWRDIWSAGHGVGDVSRIETVDDLVLRMKQDYDEAQAS